MTSSPRALAAAWKPSLNLVSLSQVKYLAFLPNGVASRICCATQASVGRWLALPWTTRREPSWMKIYTYERYSQYFSQTKLFEYGRSSLEPIRKPVLGWI
jgi:hypothetical protein